MRDPKRIMFKLLYPDGTYSLGGTPRRKYSFSNGYTVDDLEFRSSKNGKIWSRLAFLKNHLRLLSHYDHTQKKMISDIPKLKGSVVIEYELVEKRRIPIEEFMKED